MVRRVGVVVLGDLGRSPRMLYHVQSLLGHGFAVDLVGQAGTPLPARLAASPGLTVRQLQPLPASLTRLPRLLAYTLKEPNFNIVENRFCLLRPINDVVVA